MSLTQIAEFASVITPALAALIVAVYVGIRRQMNLVSRESQKARDQITHEVRNTRDELSDELRQRHAEQTARVQASLDRLNGRVVKILDGISSPAWLKVAKINPDSEQIEFRFEHVNEVLSREYDMPLAKVRDKTDLEIHDDQESAAEYYRDDLETLRQGRVRLFVEPWQDDFRISIKLPIRGALLGVLGFTFEPSNEDLREFVESLCAATRKRLDLPEPPDCPLCRTTLTIKKTGGDKKDSSP